MKYNVGDKMVCRVINSRNSIEERSKDPANFYLEIKRVEPISSIQYGHRFYGTYQYFNSDVKTSFSFYEVELEQWVDEYRLMYSPLLEALS